METLRLKVRDAVQEYLQRPENITITDVVDASCDIADIIFEVLGILEEDQDIEGAQVKVIKEV